MLEFYKCFMLFQVIIVLSILNEETSRLHTLIVLKIIIKYNMNVIKCIQMVPLIILFFPSCKPLLILDNHRYHYHKKLKH